MEVAVGREKKAETGDRTRDSLVLEGQVGNVEESSTARSGPAEVLALDPKWARILMLSSVVDSE